MRIEESLRYTLEHEAEDGVIRYLAAEGLVGGEDVVAFRLSSLGSDQNSVGELREHESVREDGCWTVNDDKTEFVAPCGEKAGHARGGDELGGARRTSAGVNDREQR
jgi:hypothetical protein